MILQRIRNKYQLLKQNANVRSLPMVLKAAEVGLKSVDPYLLVKTSLKIGDSILGIRDVKGKTIQFDLSLFDSIYVVGAGKAAARMFEGLISVLNRKITDAAITIPYNVSTRPHYVTTKRLSSFITKASHPLPDKNGVRGSRKILTILENATSKDLVFALISGGGSALMPLPIKGITLSEKLELISKLLASGASIEELNIVRKHLSGIKGGRLVKSLKNHARLISLILSDVVSDNIETIASGPTAPDSTSFNDAKIILQKYSLWDKEKIVSESIRKIINDGVRKSIDDTPKASDPVFRNVNNLIIGNNSLACNAIFSYLSLRRIRTMNLGSSFTGQSCNLGTLLFKLVDGFLPESVPYAFVLGGETTVKLSGGKIGIGGRNQEAVLTAASKFGSWGGKDFTIMCLGTDGIDGNSKAAGALITPNILTRITKKNIKFGKYLNKHDSSTFLRKVGSTVITDATGTNVNDISIVCRLS